VKLKPCLFCHAEATIKDGDGYIRHEVDCYLWLMTGRRETYLVGNVKRAWNKRAESDLLGECLEAIEDAKNILFFINEFIVASTDIPNVIKRLEAILAKRKGEL